MNKRFLTTICICIFILLIGFSLYMRCSKSEIPYEFPKIKITYNNENVPSSKGQYNWIYGVGGSSNITGPSYEVGKQSEIIKCTPNSYINVFFKTRPIKALPKRITVLLWKDTNSEPIIYKEDEEKDSISVLLPDQEGEYIFEIQGYWDDKRNTSSIINVSVER
ncbi:MAG: hypothetical protein MR639_00565 [Clostridium sp.]|uniref:hypothetical protein n=1 Tax=Clostridium sp. TaxID=1506 RepID=UPI002A8F2C6C|nr:hypothetical protein [Clostridium sp.]MDY5097005.1 hypothetical protein [Clostridium sp.]